jgi:predicted secreted hydrolase
VKRRDFIAGLGLSLLIRNSSSGEIEFPSVVPGRVLRFPRDHGAHPEYRTEWWYATGWLAAGDEPLGFQATFFRSRLPFATDNPSAFTPRQIVFAHAALSDPSFGRLRDDQRAAREALGLAGASETTTDACSAWLDHEWSSDYLAPDAAGWDWCGINLGHGGALMAFRIRSKRGGVYWAGGTLATERGKTVFMPAQIAFRPLRTWRSPRTDVEYPVAMRVTAGDASWDLEPLMNDQELDSRASTGTIYWEGAVRAMQQGKEAGRGYLELTGYGQSLEM